MNYNNYTEPPEPVEPVTAQPGLHNIQVRPMRVEDAEFAGRLTVEAFESKYKHCVGERK